MTQPTLPAIDWQDVDEWDDLDPDPRLHDLRGQGLTAIRLHTIQDVTLAGSWL